MQASAKIGPVTLAMKEDAERLVRDTFSMDKARFSLMYEHDPRCRPQNFYVATVNGQLVGTNGFREVQMEGLFSDGRACGRGIVSGATAVKAEYRRMGVSKKIFREAWQTLGREYSYCLGFTRQALYEGYLRNIGFAAKSPPPTILYRKALSGLPFWRETLRLSRGFLLRIKFRSENVLPGNSKAGGTKARIRIVGPDSASVVELDKLYQSYFSRGHAAASRRFEEVWKAICRERRVALIERARERGRPSSPSGYSITRSLKDKDVIEEFVAHDNGALTGLIHHAEDLARSANKIRLTAYGDPTQLSLCGYGNGYSAFDLRYLLLLRPFRKFISSLKSPKGGLRVRDEFLGETYEFGEGSALVELPLVDLTEFLWGSLSQRSLLNRATNLKGSDIRVQELLRDIRHRNTISHLNLPPLERY